MRPPDATVTLPKEGHQGSEPIAMPDAAIVVGGPVHISDLLALLVRRMEAGR